MKKYAEKLIINFTRLIKFIKNQISSPVKSPYERFLEDEINDCYNHFKKYFYSSIFFETSYEIRDYALKKSLNYFEDGDLNLEQLEQWLINHPRKH